MAFSICGSVCRGAAKPVVSYSRIQSRMSSQIRAYSASPDTVAPQNTSAKIRKVAILLASPRIPCNGAGIAEWLKPLITERLAPIPHTLDLITPSTPPLPLGPVLDGTFLPSDIKDAALYPSAAVREWSAYVSSTDLFVFLTPEYNSGFPGDLKNHLDHIYWEWRRKPALIVAYGGGGGSRVTPMLRGILQNALRMRVVEPSVGIKLPKDFTAGSKKVPQSGPFPEFLDAHTEQLFEAIDEAKKLLV